MRYNGLAVPTSRTHLANAPAAFLAQPQLMSDPYSPNPADALPESAAPDSSALLRRALRDAVESDRVSPALRDAIRCACTEARARDLPPEELLVSIKRLWFDTPEVAHLPHGGSGHVLLERVVSIAIDEYFRG